MPFDVARRGVLLGAALLLLWGARADAGPLVEPVTAPRVAAAGALPPDTLRTTVAAGAPLIQPLPDALNGASVARYALLRGPSLSGVAGRSLTWITRETAPGTYDLRLRADRADAAPDTLVVRVEVQP
jgi:hypothetical protein